MNRRFLILLILLALPSCIYKYTPDLDVEYSRAVIEGDISIGTISYFKASKVIPFTSTYINDSKVWKSSFCVEDDMGNQYKETGSAGAIDLTSASPDRRYRLVAEITLFEEAEPVVYVSDWQKPAPAPLIGELTETLLDYDEEGKAMTLSLALNLSSTNESSCYKWDYEELYRYRSILGEPQLEYMGNGIIHDHRNDEDMIRWWYYSWCWMESGSHRSGVAIAKALRGLNLENHEFLTLDMRSQKIAAGEYFIRLIARSIPEDQYSYLNAVNQGSEDTGSLFSPVPGEQIGNIRNQADPDDYAIGYVGVNTVAKRLFKVRTRGYGTKANAAAYMTQITELLKQHMPNSTPEEVNAAAFNAGYYPYKLDGITGECWWVPTFCVDCRKSGGTLEKPSGWE